MIVIIELVLMFVNVNEVIVLIIASFMVNVLLVYKQFIREALAVKVNYLIYIYLRYGNIYFFFYIFSS